MKLKRAIRNTLLRLGYDVRRNYFLPIAPAGDPDRIIGSMQLLLEDLAARGFSPVSILDVGGNLGSWSRLAKQVFPAANCFLIEPQIEMKPSLDAFCNEYPGSQWFLVGAGSVPSQMTLSICDNLGGSSFLPSESPDLTGNRMQRVVDIITIDSLLRDGKIPMPQLVKLDVQGYELEALLGGEKLFGPVEAFILEISFYRFLSEKQPIFHEVVAFMAERGYFAYDLPGYLRRPFDGAIGQIDICFAKRAGMLRANNRWA